MKKSDLMVVGEINSYGNTHISIERETNLHRIIKELMIQHCIRKIDCSLVPSHFEFESSPESVLNESIEDDRQEDIRDQYIDALDITYQCANRLKRSCIYRVDELLRKTEFTLMRVRGIGEKSLIEIKKALSFHDLTLRKEMRDE
ncbi:hypothetical protein LCGC14_2147260 [marine sediment metagenome]|uniref:RNA polymerase alpha subunit C-terminal domain-containing protein n=1 Tax=marine sediment metagenome TaxID=412755 RepID=A0A0F9EIR7_9ZZZZ